MHEHLEQRRRALACLFERGVEDADGFEQPHRRVATLGEHAEGGVGPRRELVGQGDRHEVLLRTEVVGDGPEVGAGGVGDRTRRGALAAVLPEAGARRCHQAVAGACVAPGLGSALRGQCHTYV